ncbi:MAG TPA: type II toxin-antitoxin system VapC family toxin [Terriglobia bacterium]|nr:type II toxin-antitoxin system VapC family toxin [Terriglobia bacterium]
MILDTNALSAIAEGEYGSIQEFARTGQIAIPVIVLGEYRFGIAHSRHKIEYDRWLLQIVAVCRILEVSEETAVSYAQLRSQLKHAGTPIPSNDAWIAALCLQHSLPILSRDQHFDLVEGLERIEW